MSDHERNMVIMMAPASGVPLKNLPHTIRSSAGTLVVAPALGAAKSSLVLKRFERAVSSSWEVAEMVSAALRPVQTTRCHFTVAIKEDPDTKPGILALPERQLALACDAHLQAQMRSSASRVRMQGPRVLLQYDAYPMVTELARRL